MPDPRLPASVFDPDLASEPHGRCVRCGRPTPLGVSMCDEDNPGRIGAPSPTQAHGTIVAGVGVGILALALIAKLATSGVGPFDASIVGQESRPDGSVVVGFTVTNAGSHEGAATCHVSRGSIARPDDPLFLTAPIPAGGSASFEETVQPPDPSTIVGEAPAPIQVTCR